MLKLALGLILATATAVYAQTNLCATDECLTRNPGALDIRTLPTQTFDAHPRVETPPGPLQFQFHIWSGSQALSITTMATVDAAGNVAINWPLVEKAVKENNPAEQMTFYARLFLAIRDKTYKDLP